MEDQDAQALFDRLTQYHASLLAESRLIAAEVDRQLLAAGQEPAAEHLCAVMFDNPYGAGGNVLMNVYAESNGPGAGEVHQVGQVNLCLNSPAISNGSEAMGFSTQDFKASIDGGVLAATSGLEAPGPISASGPISSEADIRSGADIHAAGDLAGGSLALRALSGHGPEVRITAGGLPRGPQAPRAAVGDIVLNTDPRIGQPIGWVMTAQGWARFGPISRETRVI